MKERDSKTHGKDGFQSLGGRHEEGRVFIQYKPKAKAGLKKDMDDLDAEDAAASPG